MILERIELRHYRCFESLKVPLDPKLNVFVGTNGSGKSSILRAIAACLVKAHSRFPMERKTRTALLNTWDIRQAENEPRVGLTSITALAHSKNLESFEWTVSPQKYETIRSILKLLNTLKDELDSGTPPELIKVPGHRPLDEAMDRIVDAITAKQPYQLPVVGYYGTNRAVDVPHNRLRVKQVPTESRRLAGLEGAFHANADFRRAVGWFDMLEQRELRHQRDEKHQRSLPELDAVRHAIFTMLPEVSNPRIDANTGRFAVDIADPPTSKIKLFLDQLSDGYQVMLGVVMDFALRMAIANPAETPEAVLAQEAILIIDEVDLHLHPSWQQRVIPDLRRTFPNTQLILTTHSPQVATTVPSENLRILRDSRVYAAPGGTDGAEAQRLLEDVFGVPARPKQVGPTQKLEQYLRLVDQHQWDTPEAKQLRQELDEWSQGQEPKLFEADLQIENLEWEAAN